MYDTERITVELRCIANMVKILIDRFGENIRTAVIDENTFNATVEVSLSSEFYGWLFGFGGKSELIGPLYAVEIYKTLLRNTITSY